VVICSRTAAEKFKEMKPDNSNDSDENAGFNGAELSESVLGRDWNSPQEDAAWSNL
jgi:hypothetical protein